MSTPPAPATPGRSSSVPDASLETRVIAWLALKREMEELHARLQYVKLMLKMGVGKP